MITLGSTYRNASWHLWITLAPLFVAWTVILCSVLRAAPLPFPKQPRYEAGDRLEVIAVGRARVILTLRPDGTATVEYPDRKEIIRDAWWLWDGKRLYLRSRNSRFYGWWYDDEGNTGTGTTYHMRRLP